MDTLVDTARYKRWALPHPLVLLWFLSPTSAFNELVLGQRLPRLLLIDKASDSPLMERCYIPCPGCNEMHDARLWSQANAFGHWFGYVCPACMGVIPCLWSVTSLLLLAVTAPVWVPTVYFWKGRWLEFEKRRVLALRERGMPEAAGIPWANLGVVYFGGFMWVVIDLIPQLFLWAKGHHADWIKVAITLPVWLVGGWAWGRAMRFFMTRRPTGTTPPSQ